MPAGICHGLTFFCDCETMETMVALRYKNLGRHIMKPGDQDEISVRWILNFVQDVELLNA
jgi:hypothetical protein